MEAKLFYGPSFMSSFARHPSTFNVFSRETEGENKSVLWNDFEIEKCSITLWLMLTLDSENIKVSGQAVDMQGETKRI